MADNNENWNFRTLLGQGTFVNISYQLTSAKLVLPFLYMGVGAPVLFAGLILPIVQVSALVSQLVSAPVLSGGGLRKWYIALALITMAAALSVVGVASDDIKAEWMAGLFLLVAAVVGISQGISGLAAQDLIGRVLSQKRRSVLLFTQTGLAGLITIVIAVGSQRFVGESNSLNEHLELLWAGIVLAVFAGIIAILIRETPGNSRPAEEQQSARIADADVGPSKRLYVQFTSSVRVPWFRRFLVARTLYLSIELAMPFYAVHAAIYHVHDHQSLSVFVIASSVGLVVGSMLWQRIEKISISAVMMSASIIACAGGVLAVTVEMVPEVRGTWLYGGIFLLIAMAAQGTQNARKLYIVGATSDEERPTYIAIGNTITGGFGVLVAFAFGALAHVQSAVWPIWCIIALNVAAAIYTTRLQAPRVPAAAQNLGS